MREEAGRIPPCFFNFDSTARLYFPEGVWYILKDDWMWGGRDIDQNEQCHQNLSGAGR